MVFDPNGELLNELNELNTMFNTDEYSDMVFAHGDLNHGNIIKEEDSDDVVFVDFEFSGFNER